MSFQSVSQFVRTLELVNISPPSSGRVTFWFVIGSTYEILPPFSGLTTFGSNQFMRLWRSVLGRDTSYRNPKFKVSLGRTFQLSCTYPAYWKFSVAGSN